LIGGDAVVGTLSVSLIQLAPVVPRWLRLRAIMVDSAQQSSRMLLF
jgi:hypothetical protein